MDNFGKAVFEIATDINRLYLRGIEEGKKMSPKEETKALDEMALLDNAELESLIKTLINDKNYLMEKLDPEAGVCIGMHIENAIRLLKKGLV